MKDLPAPLVPADIDLRDIPLPRDLFVRMGVEAFGIPEEEARKLVDEIADDMEGKRQ